jgi:pSer/pThr/pTyr-binding forkhead associated (FHA) protein
LKTFVVGRSPYADVVVADPTVAEFHAEIVRTDDGRIFVDDCGSASGTRRLVESNGRSAWTLLRQGFIGIGDTLRLGEHECLVADLVAAATEDRVVHRGSRAVPVRPGGRLSRDPWTGEIVRRGR